MGLSGLEPPTSPLSGVRSNQLSYRPIIEKKRVTRIELATTAWKAVVLPLNYTRKIKNCGGRIRTYDLRVMSPTRCQLLHPAIIKKEDEGFEPPHGLTRLSVFKTDPFSQTWVILHNNTIIFSDP